MRFRIACVGKRCYHLQDRCNRANLCCMVAPLVHEVRAAEPDAAGILLGMLGASNDACWCMEFGEPVDLSAPEREVVRQVFDNSPRWRFCNPAMARLYLLPGDERFESRPVREIFPRNRQNEDFVRQLIEHGFELDAAPALDTRYDGIQIHVENDVRADIAGGRLVRIYGVVRDVDKHRRRESLLRRRLEAATALLDALPHPFMAVDDNGVVVACNPAAETLLGASDRTLAGLELCHALEPALAPADAAALVGAATGGFPEAGAPPIAFDVGLAAGGAWRCTVAGHGACKGGALLVFAETSVAGSTTAGSAARRGAAA